MSHKSFLLLVYCINMIFVFLEWGWKWAMTSHVPSLGRVWCCGYDRSLSVDVQRTSVILSLSASVLLTAVSFCSDAGAAESFAMATKIVTQRCQEEQMDQMSHSMAMSSLIKKRKFKSR